MNTPRPSSPPTRLRRGFTLIELLVATSVSIVVLGLLIAVVSNVTGAWTRTTGNLQTDNQAKLILDQLTTDLQSAILRNDGALWFAASLQGIQVGTGDAAIPGAVYTNTNTKTKGGPPTAASYVVNPPGRQVADYRFGHAGVWLRFFTRPTDAGTSVATQSTPRAVSYQIGRVPLGGNVDDLRWVLFRSEVTSTNTAATGLDLSDPNSAYNTAGGGVVGAPGNIRTPVGIPNYLGVNVIDFGVRVFQRNAQGVEVLSFPSVGTTPDTRRSFLGTSNSTLPDPYAGALPLGVQNQASFGMPSSVEVIVRILTPAGADQIQALESGKIPLPPGLSNEEYEEYWWNLALSNSRVFSRRVTLPNPGF